MPASAGRHRTRSQASFSITADSPCHGSLAARPPSSPGLFQPTMQRLIDKILRPEVWMYWRDTSRGGAVFNVHLADGRGLDLAQARAAGQRISPHTEVSFFGSCYRPGMSVSSAGADGRTSRASGVQSVARAAVLLGAVVDSSSSGVTLTELSKITGLNVSTVHRLLGTLCSEGLLCRSREGDRFLPGPVLLRLGRRSLAASGLPEVTAILKELADGTGETASIGMRRGDNVLVLVSVQSEQPLRYLGEPGVSVPLAGSAMGLAMMAFDATPRAGRALPRGVTTQTFTQGRTGNRPGDGTDRGSRDADCNGRGAHDGRSAEWSAAPEQWALRVRLLAAQFRGYAVFDGAEDSGLRGLAAPVDSGSPYVQLAVDIQGPAGRMADARLDGLGARVIAAADSLRGLPVALALGQL
ncbi:IclR family transcriptional regulator [Streptomyces malaysiensis]|uniref:IclR family transcriptional regulator n=1 Tax=Streptomyces malaysiensis TaxID=92644 RepID=UPI0022B251B8|nr:helix-turn-helix domain-containing protein [Streptomyces sp. M56]